MFFIIFIVTMVSRVNYFGLKENPKGTKKFQNEHVLCFGIDLKKSHDEYEVLLI